jgi:hypothetical protein
MWRGRPSGVVYLQCLFPHMGVAKHSCYFLELRHDEVRSIPLPRTRVIKTATVCPMV